MGQVFSLFSPEGRRFRCRQDLREEDREDWAQDFAEILSSQLVQAKSHREICWLCVLFDWCFFGVTGKVFEIRVSRFLLWVF